MARYIAATFLNEIFMQYKERERTARGAGRGGGWRVVYYVIFLSASPCFSHELPNARRPSFAPSPVLAGRWERGGEGGVLFQDSTWLRVSLVGILIFPSCRVQP